jgi:hypothetical protein
MVTIWWPTPLPEEPMLEMQRRALITLVGAAMVRNDEAEGRGAATAFEQGLEKLRCTECGGTGDWPYGPTPAEYGSCVDYKDTGRILVSI